MSNYSRLDHVLHTVALNWRFVRAATFDIERTLGRIEADQLEDGPHVFITGLARAGTSILLRILHGSGRFATQTYRDMPFVLAPQLWSKISGRHRRKGELAERAHKDGLEISFDSVEAFEEVFWLTFASDHYVREDHLLAHAVDGDLCAEFRDYVAVVVAAHNDPARRRYLSKNNNNVLRLGGLADAFPDAHIVVPFRNHYQQARSLLAQHERARESQATDPFERKYMGWLGHFEFGLDYRPFTFDGDPPRSEGDPGRVDHWLKSWTRVYSGVLASAPDNVVFWDYDAFCNAPHKMLSKLAGRVGLQGALAPDAATNVRPPRPYEVTETPDALILRSARETYHELRVRAEETLG